MMEYKTFGDINSNIILVQMIERRGLSAIEREVDYINELAPDRDFCLLAVMVDNWNDDLSPWEAPAVFGKDGFLGKAGDTFSVLMELLKEDILKERNLSEVKMCIGGYSLAGLFALWCAYQTDIFDCVAAASPSVWFLGFYDYAKEKPIKTKAVYLSLGDKEEKAKNKLMSTVGDVIREYHALLSKELGCVLEWNEGNHFKEHELRMAKGFAWVINEEGL